MTLDEYIKQHNHINYCEVVVQEDGQIFLAVPAHNYYLMNLIMGYDVFRCTEEKQAAAYKRLYGLDLQDLCDLTHCAVTWYDGWLLPHHHSPEQENVIQVLKERGIMNPDGKSFRRERVK